MANFQDYQGLSQAVYQQNISNVVHVNNHTWEAVQVKNDTSNGYTGAVYINKETKEIILVNRGTEVTDSNDLHSDVQMAVALIPSQLDSSQSLVDFAKNYAEQNGYDLSITGHSLGGSLSELQGLQTGVDVVTFNSFGTVATQPISQ